MTKLLAVIAGLALASIAIADPPVVNRLTSRRIAELTAPAGLPLPHQYQVTVSGLRLPIADAVPALPEIEEPVSVSFQMAEPEVTMECIRECRFPTSFAPPKPAPIHAPLDVTPTLPLEFEKVNTGWTIRFSAKPHGSLIALAGVAEYVETEFVPGSYGPLAGPIYSEGGREISPNAVHQPKFQTTTTRFHLFAVPGESYEVMLYRGNIAGKHKITVVPE